MAIGAGRAEARLRPLKDNNYVESSCQECDYDPMKWPKPEFGSGRVRAAGQLLAERIAPSPTLTLDDAYNIAGNWRSAHGFPLQVLGVTLNRRAKREDPKALYAQRLKRMPSIISKLKRFDSMQLDGMNDLGGC